MKKDLVAKASIVIHAPVSKVWEALTSPALIKQYLFGTDVVTDWKVGSSIIWSGEWQGKHYEDKGTILRVIPQKLLETTYWSSMGGLPDRPENYKNVTYELKPERTGTTVTIIQDNNATEEAQKHSEGNWNMVLDGLKKLLEK